MAADATVILQTCPQRQEDAKKTIESLRASDAASALEVMEHPRGVERCRFYREVLAKMAAAETPYVIRCEDDILVNRHLVHNFLSWPALTDPRFGCGWLYVPAAAFTHESATRLGPFVIRNSPIMYGALCVGMPTAHARAALDLFDRWIADSGCGLTGCTMNRRCEHETRRPPPRRGQDTLLSQAVWQLGKRVFYHQPVLAENRVIPSARGTTYLRRPRPEQLQAGAHFKPNWRRQA